MRFFICNRMSFLSARICKSFLLIVFSGLLISCAPLQIEDDFTEPLYASSLALDYEDIVIPELHTPGQERGLAQTLNPFPIDNTSSVRRWLAHYSTGEGRDIMKELLERSGRYVAYMSRIFYQEGLPSELVYMSMLESGFRATIRSHAEAVGYWQFIYSTAKMYGLQMNRSVDERHDFKLSTQAAARHLKDLYHGFDGDWRLAMSAYNCGKKCVENAIKKYRTNNYWSLVQKKALPGETRKYVPKIMAMTKIALQPEDYGFYRLQYAKPLRYDIVEIDRDVSIDKIIRDLNISEPEFKQLNPKFKTNRILASQSSYIRVPI